MKTASVDARLVGRKSLSERNETYYKFEVRYSGKNQIFFILVYENEKVLLNNVFEALPLSEQSNINIHRVCSHLVDTVANV
jgi:hypothetical protein